MWTNSGSAAVPDGSVPRKHAAPAVSKSANYTCLVDAKPAWAAYGKADSRPVDHHSPTQSGMNNLSPCCQGRLTNSVSWLASR